MAIVDGVSTFRDTPRRRKEGVQGGPQAAGVEVKPTAAEKQAQLQAIGGPENKFAADLGRKTALTSLSPSETIFDPKRRSGLGLAGPAGAPRTPIEARTLAESAALINAGVKATEEPTEDQKKALEPVEEVEVEETVPVPTLSAEQRIKATKKAFEETRLAIEAEPARLNKAADIAQAQATANKEIADIEFEQELAAKESKRLGSEFSADKLEEKITAVRGISADRNVTLAQAENIFNAQQKVLGGDPNAQNAFDELSSLRATGELDEGDAYGTAVVLAGGNSQSAAKAMAASGFTQTQIKNQQRDYSIDVLGMSPEDFEETSDFEIGQSLIESSLDSLAAQSGIEEAVLNGTATPEENTAYVNNSLQSLSSIKQSIDKVAANDFPDDFIRKTKLQQVIDDPRTNQRVKSALQQELNQLTGADVFGQEEFLSGAGTLEQRQSFLDSTRLLNVAKKGKTAGTGAAAGTGVPKIPSSITSDAQADEILSQFPDDILQAAQDIMSPTSTSRLSDISVKGNRREKVSSALNVLKKRALDKGDFAGVMASSAGGKDLGDSSIQSFEKGLTVLSQLGDLQNSLEGEATGPIQGIIRSNNPFDEKARLIKAQLTAVVPNLARGVFGEVGVLTDNDVRLYQQTLPNLTSQEDLSQALLGITVRTVQRSLENKIKLNAGLGRDMSGVQDIYFQVKEEADRLLSTLPGAVEPEKEALFEEEAKPSAPSEPEIEFTQTDFDDLSGLSTDDLEALGESNPELLAQFINFTQ